MKDMIETIATLKMTKTGQGEVHYTGTLPLASLRKNKAGELHVVLMPVANTPASLLGLLQKDDVGPEDLLMFAAISEGNKASRSRKQG